MGVLDFLSPLLTVGTQAYGAQQNAEAQGKKDDVSSALQMLKMKRDQEKASLAAANTQSEMAHRTAEDAGKGVFQGAVRSPGEMASFDQDATKVMDTGLPGAPNAYEDMKAADPERNAPDRYQAISPTQTLDKYQAPEAVQSRKLSAVDELRAKRDAANQTALADRQSAHEDRSDARQSRSLAALADRMSQKPDPVQIMQGTDKDGQPHFYRVPKVSGDASEVGGLSPNAAATGRTSATQQQQQARLLAAMSEARLADERMRTYEDKLLSGEKEIGPLKQAAGNLMMNLSGTHSTLGALTQGASEAGLNAHDGDYAQYLRDAATIGRAEQMISPRGGNESMVRANSLLARAGTGAARGTIEASRMARQALFGQSGGIAQTMTPQQTQGLEAGVAKIKAGEHGASSDKPPLAQRIQELKAHGLTKEAARVQLQHEGYSLGGP